ncbi:hypothetical protein GMA8713_03785 [Grimontia marina]|uniref:Uncharacterized protein n=1 Tax=Grimontia marina TaxID=646534 RepID=A0A128FG41_9GAMM|nr:hypothetical protein GMA8713_03785 [Grimontia marina]
MPSVNSKNRRHLIMIARQIILPRRRRAACWYETGDPRCRQLLPRFPHRCERLCYRAHHNQQLHRYPHQGIQSHLRCPDSYLLAEKPDLLPLVGYQAGLRTSMWIIPALAACQPIFSPFCHAGHDIHLRAADKLRDKQGSEKQKASRMLESVDLW